MATASKNNLSLDSAKRVEAATDKFLAGMAWDDCGNFRRECICNFKPISNDFYDEQNGENFKMKLPP